MEGEEELFCIFSSNHKDFKGSVSLQFLPGSTTCSCSHCLMIDHLTHPGKALNSVVLSRVVCVTDRFFDCLATTMRFYAGLRPIFLAMLGYDPYPLLRPI
jgi:hypothetical protein